MGKVCVLTGNAAIVEGALAVGVRFFAGYPITPASPIIEAMARELPKVGGKFIQMEDEVGAMGTVIGASLAGLKAMDATSGPGFSLKAESIGLAAMLEIPCVLVQVQRVGPSTGMSTLPSQGDVMMTRWGTHGDHPIIVLTPSSVRECFDLTVKAVNLAERFRTIVILLTDAMLASLRERVELPDNVEIVERPRPVVPPDQYQPYAAGENGVPPMADFGSGYHWYANSSVHDEDGQFATSNHEIAWALFQRLHNKILNYRKEVVFYSSEWLDDAEVVVFAYGSTARSARAAVKMARGEGIKAGFTKALTIWPFPDEAIINIAGKVKTIVVPEMNMGQLVEKVREINNGKSRVISVARVDGRLIPPEEILEAIREGASG